MNAGDRIKIDGFSIVELMVSFAILGIAIVGFSSMRSSHFKTIEKVEVKQEATRVGHYLLTFADCARTKSAPGFDGACASNGGIRLLAANGGELLPVTGKTFDKLRATASCSGGFITFYGTGPDWSPTPKALLDGVPLNCAETTDRTKIQLGINFEDLTDGGDMDFNDAVVCFQGSFRFTENYVESAKDQTLKLNVTNNSGCDHNMTFEVVGLDGSKDPSRTQKFSSRNPPNPVSISVKRGERLLMEMASKACSAPVTTRSIGSKISGGPNNGRYGVDLAKDCCRTGPTPMCL